MADTKSFNGAIASNNAQLNGNYGFIASTDGGGNGIKSSGSYNTILGSDNSSQIQNVTVQSTMIGTSGGRIIDGRFGLITNSSGSKIDQENNSTDALPSTIIGSRDSDIGLSKSSLSLGGTSIISSTNSDIGQVGSTQDICQSTILSSNSSSIKSTGTAVKNNVIIASENVNLTDDNNVIVLGVNTYTGGTDNVVVVPGMVVTNYATLNYADDTAAAAGGIPLGGVYHNAGDLRIRIV